MTEAIDGIITFVVLAAIGWALAFGWSTAALARSLGRSPTLGLALGICFGPLGWLLLFALERWGPTTRTVRRSIASVSDSPNRRSTVRQPPRSSYD